MKTTKELNALSDHELRAMLARITGSMCDNCGQEYCDCAIVEIGSGSPDYPSDLNATASVKATLTKRQKEVFIDILDGSIMAETDPTKYIGYIETSPDDIFDRFNNASARDECIALILTLEATPTPASKPAECIAQK